MAALHLGDSRGRRNSAPPHRVIDRQVGSRIRLRRVMLGLSQGKLGDAIGLTYQQVQKYELGVNRIASSRLHQLSRVLAVPVSFFFDDTDPVHAPPVVSGVEGASAGIADDPLTWAETAELVEAYCVIEDRRVRQCLLVLASTLGATRQTGPLRRQKRRPATF